jgi:hypothetical protein
MALFPVLTPSHLRAMLAALRAIKIIAEGKNLRYEKTNSRVVSGRLLAGYVERGCR